MPRFFVTPENRADDKIIISGSDARHIARSLRMAVGDAVTLADGTGTEYECVLEKIRDEECECRITSERISRAEPPVRITLYMAYPKGDKLETVIQKAVELGASEIVPFESSRCIKRPKADKAQDRKVRLERIAWEAAKQCGRAVLPSVALPLSFTEAVKSASEAELAIFCYEGDNTLSLKSILESTESVPKTVSVMVGSEGGFSEEEANAAIAAGMQPANLGPRILRCETAPDYCLSAISYFFEL